MKTKRRTKKVVRSKARTGRQSRGKSRNGKVSKVEKIKMWLKKRKKNSKNK